MLGLPAHETHPAVRVLAKTSPCTGNQLRRMVGAGCRGVGMGGKPERLRSDEMLRHTRFDASSSDSVRSPEAGSPESIVDSIGSDRSEPDRGNAADPTDLRQLLVTSSRQRPKRAGFKSARSPRLIKRNRLTSGGFGALIVLTLGSAAVFLIGWGMWVAAGGGNGERPSEWWGYLAWPVWAVGIVVVGTAAFELIGDLMRTARDHFGRAH
jgi:hypothetical protein